MARRSDHSRDEIREMALEAADSIIASNGYASLTARKVAAEIGYTVGTLYLVFENLDDLVLHVNARTLDQLHNRLVEAAAQAAPGLPRARALAQCYLEFATGEAHRWNAIFELRLPQQQHPPDFYQQRVLRTFELVEDVLRQLAPDRPEPDIRRAARALWGGVHGVCILGLTRRLGARDEYRLDELVESLISNYLGGFCRATESD